MNFGPGYIRFPIYPYPNSDISISDFQYIHSYKMDISEKGISEMEISVWKFLFPISPFSICPFYSYGYIGNRIWIYRKSDIAMDQNSNISDFWYIQTDMSIFSYGHIGMDISEMMRSEVSEVSEIRYIQISDMSRPICPFLAMDISEMDISEMM
jgi:hypothetical protein